MNKKSKLDESNTEFLDLNDNCLEHVFDFCDVHAIISLSKVCKRLNELVTTIHFPKQTRIEYIAIRRSEEDFIEILNSVGKYVVDLDIYSCYRRKENVTWYKALGRLTGDRIRRLKIYDQNMSHEMVDAIAPMLQHLEELQLFISEFDEDYIDLRSMCPNMRRLIIKGFAPSSQNTGHWPRLEELTFTSNSFSTSSFSRFMEHNPQLRKLTNYSLSCMVKMNDVAQYLINLEQLVLYQDSSDLSPDNILKLRRLPHLKRLILRYLKTDFDDIVASAIKMNGLIELQLEASGMRRYYDGEFYEPNPHCILGIALELEKLQVFGISYCKLKDDTVLEFLRLADNLRDIHIHKSSFKLTQNNIDAIINARKKNRNRIDPLTIYVDSIFEDLQKVSYF